ncbi:MAG: hypothetical protein J6J12_07925 [Oscillospiraceae bacterium]|nr:hypothetical protein [Oscillospiraceae bacterium]
MKKTQLTHLYRTIRKNLISFLAVAMMAATAIAIFVGDQSAAKAILDEANRYFVENRLQSLEISSPYGITREDIEEMSTWEGVDAVEGGFSAMVLAELGGGTGKTLVEAHALLDTMNLPVVLEGRLPSAVDEVALEQTMAEKEGLRVGDQFRITHEGQLKTHAFTVTAIINQPSYCYARPRDARGQSDIGIGSAYYYIAFAKGAFDEDYYSGAYSTAYVRNDALDQYHYFSDEYKQNEAAFQQQIEALGAQRARLRYEAVKEALPEQLDDARKELERQEKNLEVGQETLSVILQIMGLSGDSQYQDILQQAKSAFEAGELALSEGWDALAQAEKTANDLAYCDWIVSPRQDIGDVRSIATAVEGLYGLSYSMAMIFVIVAITVCYAAISRMISESSALMGMQKALGFTSKEIRAHFMAYSILCGVWGALEGWVCGYLVVQFMNVKIYQTLFLMGDVPLAFAWDAAIAVSVFFVGIFILAAYGACGKKVNLPATELLRGETTQRDRRFWFENWKPYQKLRLYSKTMIKNALVDKSRMLTTVMGVAGCATLLVISFTLLLTMRESEKIPFEEYFLYENRLVVDSTKSDGTAFEEVLEEKNIPYTRILDKLKLCRPLDGEWSGGHIVAVSDGEGLKDFMVLEDPQSREILEVPEEGALVSIRCAEVFGLDAGSELEILGSDGSPRRIRVAGVVEHYLAYNLFVVSDSYYEAVFGEAADESVFLLKGSIDGLYEAVKDLEGFLSIRDNSEFVGIGDILNIIVIVCFVFAALMAVMVMLNQNVMYIEEKVKELSVMRINGFTLRETRAFVSRDNFVLTAMGIVAGWILGMILGYQVLRILEVGVNHYIRTPSWKACLIAGAICGIFAWAMNKLAVRRIAKLNLTNVNAN